MNKKFEKQQKSSKNQRYKPTKKLEKLQVCACSTAGLVLIRTVNLVSIEIQTEKYSEIACY